MSDRLVKIIPANPYMAISDSILREAKDDLQNAIQCDSIAIQTSDHPAFVDCGGSLERIFCPVCHSEIDFEWWGTAMDRAYEEAFRKLDVVLPCCGETVSLNDLQYDFPCGFSTCAIEILNPIAQIDAATLDAVKEIFRTGVRVICARL